MHLNVRNDIFYMKGNKKIKNIQENPVIMTKTKQLVDGLKGLTNEQKKTEAPTDVKEILFSNDTRDGCKTMCRICNTPQFLYFMRHHTRVRHCLTIEEYRQIYGDHRGMIIKEVYHKCGICFAIIQSEW